MPIPGSSGASSAVQPIELPPQQWVQQWQALATDSQKGVLGAAVNEATAQYAEQSAMADCKAKGGTQCHVEISFGNGCVAMVVGNSRMNVKDAASSKGAR